MISVLATHRQELEQELQERLQDFFAKNNESPESVSVDMKLSDTEQAAMIHIRVKDRVKPDQDC